MSDKSYQQTCQALLEPTGIQINGNSPWDMQVHNPRTYQKILAQGSLGLGEAYMDGWWDSPAIDQFFHKVLSTNLRGKIKTPYAAWNVLKARAFNLQSRERSRQVAEQHYDLGQVYQKMLDPRMVYTCAYWKNADNLADAQESKLELTCRKTELQPGMKVLDIGCGWGSFLKYAAEKHGIEGTGITISQDQVNLGNHLCQDLPIELKLQDYRDTNGQYDAIVSLGMFEHVGPKNYRTYMEIVDRNLKPRGLFLLHTIGFNTPMKRANPWINKYIFPGGILPAQSGITKATEGIFVNEDWHSFTDEIGSYYDKTLMAWNTNFNQNWQELDGQYNERFKRMWNYYLLSFAGSFRSRTLQLWQAVFSRKGEKTGYTSIR